MKSRILLLALAMFFLLVVPGCWDYEEYEDIAQVSAIGIDFDKKTHETTFSIQYIPTTKGQKSGGASGASSGSKEIVYSATDKTIYEAVSKLQQVIYKKLFYGYLKIIVIGEDAAKYNMLDIIELLDRTPAARSTAYIIITSGKAQDALSTLEVSMLASSSEEIYHLINIANKTGSAYPVSLLDFTAMLAVPGLEATAPRVVIVSKTPKPEAKGGTEGNIKYDEERLGDNRVAGVAAFKRDKLLGWLNTKETLGFGWITGKNIIAYKVSESSGRVNPQDTLFYRLSKSKGKIKVRINNHKPAFEVDVKVVADLRKYYSGHGSEFLSPKEVRVMENKLSESIRSDIQAALKKGQKKFKSDLFGFGFALFRKDWKLWRTQYEKKWDKVFPYVPITVKVQTKIINTGSNNRKLDLR